METIMNIERWEIDGSRSRIQFAVRHLVLSKTRGQFTRWSGSVMVPDEDPTSAVVRVVIDASSIDTGVPRRDAHLRSEDYFDVARHPRITFVATQVTAEPDGRLRVVGSLTVKDVTREVTLVAVPDGRLSDSRDTGRARVTARTSIARRDFGFAGTFALDAGGMVIGEWIDVEIEVEAVRRSVARAA
jgi:polyisoprenoid-binding protein YceI